MIVPKQCNLCKNLKNLKFLWVPKFLININDDDDDDDDDDESMMMIDLSNY